MISSRARNTYSKYPYARGKKNLYDKNANPDGIVSCANAENVSVINEQPTVAKQSSSFSSMTT
jgi:hypothetical protein